jgi:DNA invertase Pin-like site-specific DNA recombinase
MFSVGYPHVSTIDQSVELQLDALKKVGCRRVFDETALGRQRDRPQLAEAIEFLRAGDTFVVGKLDRLARSPSQLIETIDDLPKKGCGFRSLTKAINTVTPTSRLVLHAAASLNSGTGPQSAS